MTLCGCGFGSLSGLFCVGMRTGDRKVAEDEAQAVPHLRLDLLEYGVGGAAIGAFVVAVFHQRDRCAIWSLDVVSVRRDGHGQLSLRPRSVHDATPDLARSSSARRIPSAPGFTPLGDTKLQRTMPAPSMTNKARSLVPSSALYTP